MTKPALRYQRIAVIYNADKPRAHFESQRLKKWLESRHVQVMTGVKVTPAMKKSDLAIVLGGDGTVLRVAREVAGAGVPILGVNVGRLGFLAATEVGAMYRTLARVLAGEGRAEIRTMLSVEGIACGKKFGPRLALNDCVIQSGGTGRVVFLQASVRDRMLASYSGDGLIIATPTGSTAYNLAASGPIVYPELDVLLLSPICPHTLAQRPLVYPTYEVVSVQVLRPSSSGILSLDGQVIQVLRPDDVVTIRRAPERVQLLMDPDRTYYQVLQSKLKWGGA